MAARLWTWPTCLCGHHAVYHDLKGARGRINPHLSDYHEVAWKLDAEGGLLTGHCAGTANDGCRCTVYRPVEPQPPEPSDRGR